MKEIKTKEELDEITKSGVSLIKVGAAWCGPCGVTQKNIESIADNYEGVNFIEVDAEEADELVSHLSVFNLPTIIIYKDSEPVYRHVGLMNKAQITEALNKYV